MQRKPLNGSITVQSIHYEGPDAVRVRLSPNPDDAERWRHEPGAFITFSITPSLQRSYSLVNPIGSLPLEILVRSIPGGQGSRFFNHEAEVGRVMQAITPKSLLWRPEWNHEPQHFVCFAGGIGITPIFSLVQHAMLHPELGHRITLIYSNRTRKHALCAEALYAWEDRIDFIPLFSEDEILEDPEQVGRVTIQRLKPWLEAVGDNENTQYIISAPPALMRTIHEGLDDAQIPQDRRHTERYTSAALSEALPILASHPTTDRPDCTITLERDNGDEQFQMRGEGQSILDAALAEGLEVPSGCRGGVCMSCLAQVTEGKVQKDGDNGLTEQEQRDGLILCCRSQPQSETLKLRFIH
ncbi:MAG: iron-sulfur cluster-binding domain-containing protein [Bacteroidetes bacterium]|jgi:ring-1,2-phenylacetyl-CoA epoxidase subunit PaaE|nr:iron-sulfur cluster-binding domain-containing protein [Bacteroidota bacterium]